MTLLEKIKSSQLTGRGGANFLVAKKWQAVESGVSTAINNSKKKIALYVIANGSEGEPGVKKDYFLLDKYSEAVVGGMIETIKYFKSRFGKNIEPQGIVYLNHDYYDEFGAKLLQIIGDNNIKLFKKPIEAGYIGGEETALLNIIEGKRAEPRLKPPYPPESGLWGAPTLVQNIETYYHIDRIANDKYQQTRFFTIGGDCIVPGVFEFPIEETIAAVLEKTGNHPLKLPFEKSRFDFFVQIGGDASGEVLDSTQLDRAATGAASITVYGKSKHQPLDLFRSWVEFFKNESCGQCVPCREGSMRVVELLKSNKPNWRIVNELFDAMIDSSFCALGASIPLAVRSYLKNVHKNEIGHD